MSLLEESWISYVKQESQIKQYNYALDIVMNVKATYYIVICKDEALFVFAF